MSMVMMDTAPVEGWTFGGVATLNGTQIPDAYFDEVMAPLGPSAFMVLMYVARRTFGFKRHSDQISLDQICDGIVTREGRRLDHGTGLAKSTVVLALDRLVAFGLIRKEKNTDARGGQLANTYRIVFKDACVTDLSPLSGTRPAAVREVATPSVREADSPRPKTAQAPVRHSDRQQTVETTNSRRHTDRSKRGARVERLTSSLDSTDSLTVTTENTVTQIPAGHVVSPVGERVARLSAELGDDAPHASQTRALNIQRAAGLGDAAVLPLLDEAAAITRSQASAITKRGRGGTVIRMPYLLATLRGLAETPDVCPATDRPTGSASVRPSALAAQDVDDAPATTEAAVVWRAVQGEVRRDLTAENYAAWFAPTRAVALEEGALRVVVPTPFHRQWLEHKLRGCVERALGHTGYAAVRVVYDVATSGEASAGDDHAACVDPVDRVVPILLPSAVATPPPVAAARPPIAPSTPHPHPCPTTAAVATPLPLVACPYCRAAPCHCRLADHLQRVVAAGVAVAPVRAP